ncbi:hypothetical protein KVR01_010305 [Diaporthe batatas]|uniref:uncharacterized protein n=1 Tax=Diaporthe batatas TaxID=748121 RepID=UPI001D04A9ED|nr:uncharacterized protein KVR01_010305 [Diaporthe batatas]KAG8159668.1 hypothetical protein KVR01_010305 [Diaporthe batatas]
MLLPVIRSYLITHDCGGKHIIYHETCCSSSNMSHTFINKSAKGVVVDGPSSSAASQVLAFHQNLPHYEQTPLHSLPQVAKELQLGHVFVKDESNRFGLPSFKVLGASWAVYRALTDRLRLEPAAFMEDNRGSQFWARLGSMARAEELSLVSCTEGNWGRAVARMAKYIGVPAAIYVPSFMPETTRARIRSEGAELLVVDGSYDDGVAAARAEAERNDLAILAMDMGWEGYTAFPSWVVEGYSTMLNESDLQIKEATVGKAATHAFIPVGVGSIAHAVTQHYKAFPNGHSSRASVMTVEPTTAACLRASLESGEMTTVETGDSIMCGMNCGTLSSTAWQTLKSGVDADVTVTEEEAHAAVGELSSMGLQPGPCGAATLSALRTACIQAQDALGLTQDAIVVLFCTEGKREYEIPA